MSEVQLPEGWCEVPLLDVVPSVQYGVSLPLNDGEDGIPVMRMNNLRDGAMDVRDVKRSANPQALALRLQPGDVLFNRTNSIEHVGRTSLWRGELEGASFASYLVRLVPDRARLEPEYLVSWLNMPATQLLIRQFATPGVHQVNINPTNLRRVRIELPKDTSQQRRIAEILATVDEAMEQTEALVAKLQQMKAGLMHDLFTRGVTPEGHLRPTRQEAPPPLPPNPCRLAPEGVEGGSAQRLS